MKYSVEIRKAIEKKEFKNFWSCFDYLLMAGFNQIDSFGLSLEQFSESKIWSNVAWVRFQDSFYVDPVTGRIYSNDYREQIRHDIHFINPMGNPNNAIKDSNKELIIGIIDETNIHLSGMYGIYRKSLLNIGLMNNTILPEIEETCEVIRIKNISLLIEEYLECTFKAHFGYGFDKINEDKIKKLNEGLNGLRR